nr:MAG TPA: hypothetical protein [Caudoviricetes sp.]
MRGLATVGRNANVAMTSGLPKQGRDRTRLSLGLPKCVMALTIACPGWCH